MDFINFQLFCFFMQGMFFAEFAMLFHLQFFLELFFVSDCEIIDALANVAFHFD